MIIPRVDIGGCQLGGYHLTSRTIGRARRNSQHRSPPLPSVARRAETVTNRLCCGTWRANLHLTEIRTSSDASMPNPAARDSAGGETSLDVHLSLRGLQGHQRKSVSVLSNDPHTPNLTLWIEGEARAAVGLEPPACSFGRVNPHEPPAPITVRLAGYETAITVTEAASDHPAFSVAVHTDGRSLTVQPPVLTDPGVYRGRVTVTLSTPQRGPLVLPVSAGSTTCCAFIPPPWYTVQSKGVPRLYASGHRAQRTALRFRVTGVRLEGARGNATFQTRPDGSVHIRVQGVESAPFAPDAALIIDTDLSEKSAWRVPLKRETTRFRQP
jgi:hypothetical protein